jgi:putative ABC transport system permease protein
MRGLERDGFTMRRGFTLVEGRLFEPGAAELIVGRGATSAYRGLEIGSRIELGSMQWTVVGIFALQGGAFESEAWADLAVMTAAFPDQQPVQTIRVGPGLPEGAIAALSTAVSTRPGLFYQVTTERGLFASQAGRSTDLILRLGWPLSMIMACGALAGAANSVSYSVQSRQGETQTLRTLGFSAHATFVATLAESTLVALAGGLLGIVLAYGVFDGTTATALGADAARTVFAMTVTPELAGRALVLAAMIGLLAAFSPALSAYRAPGSVRVVSR